MSTTLEGLNWRKSNTSFVRAAPRLISKRPRTSDPSTIKIGTTVQVHDNSTFLERLVVAPSSPIYEIDEDPMKVLTGEDGRKMLKLLLSRSERSEFKILKDARFSENSVSFKLDLKFKTE